MLKRNFKIIALSWMLLMVSWPVVVEATSFVRKPLPDIVQAAPIIARGKIGMSYADWGTFGNGGRRIYTFTELRVEEVLKGRIDARSIMMREMGGEKDGTGMEVPGTAHFARDEDVLVFLTPTNDASIFQVRGMMMGKFTVQRGADGIDYVDGPAIDGRDDDGHVQSESNEAKLERWSVDRMRELIRAQSVPSVSQASDVTSRQIAQPVVSSAGAPRVAAKPSAPALQTALPEPMPNSPKFGFYLGLILVSLFVGIRLFRRHRKSRRV